MQLNLNSLNLNKNAKSKSGSPDFQCAGGSKVLEIKTSRESPRLPRGPSTPCLTHPPIDSRASKLTPVQQKKLVTQLSPIAISGNQQHVFMRSLKDDSFVKDSNLKKIKSTSLSRHKPKSSMPKKTTNVKSSFFEARDYSTRVSSSFQLSYKAIQNMKRSHNFKDNFVKKLVREKDKSTDLTKAKRLNERSFVKKSTEKFS